MRRGETALTFRCCVTCEGQRRRVWITPRGRLRTEHGPDRLLEEDLRRAAGLPPRCPCGELYRAVRYGDPSQIRGVGRYLRRRRQRQRSREPSRYLVWSAAAQMPSSCWGVYRRVAVLEVDLSCDTPSMISERAVGVRRVVATWERLHVGTTNRCAYSRAYVQATALASRLRATEASC